MDNITYGLIFNKLATQNFNGLPNIHRKVLPKCTTFIDFSEQTGVYTKNKSNSDIYNINNVSNSDYNAGSVIMDGSTSYIDTNKTAAQLGIDWNDKFTLMLWYKNVSSTGLGNVGATRNTVTGQRVWFFGRGSSPGDLRISFIDGLGNSSQCDTISQPFLINEKQKITITNDGTGLATGIKIYRNNVDVSGACANVGTMTTTASPEYNFVISALNTDNVISGFFDGSILSFQIYNDVLTTNEMKLLCEEEIKYI